jgi:hypothetical protein
MTKRRQVGLSAFSNLTAASELAVPIDDPPPKTKRKSNKVKLGAGVNATIHTPPNRVESMETSDTEISTIEEVDRRTTESSPDPTPEVYFASDRSQSGSKLSSAPQTSCPACLGTILHPLANCPVVQGGPDSIEARIAQMEKNPGFAPSSEVIAALRRFAEKARSMRTDSSNDSLDMEPSQVSDPSVALHGGVSSTGAKPITRRGHEIAEVPVGTHGEGSSSENSTKGDGARLRTPFNASSVHLHLLEDQLVPLLHGSAKRGPRRSVLDDIPSSSETESKSSFEDLMLDEEEDLSVQPSHKQKRKLSTTRTSSIEPELTSEDEEDSLTHVYMDTSHDALDRSQVCTVHHLGNVT